ncbi:hypothetical protein PHYSODRAFT_356062 [Phytophthora sojae]|uniref:Protein kinase n=1 Tax=Phytophthora sojae (strain P6497) TaxID=1094619 RepID=G5AB10_PHYSP|nr:hypothetical protein PHYSODRAFT_356062 [Phytophthora sojae]EGZ07789.1 hypothetical protein PHYSODRAFT_356062 [Phytophthora sojae]|eukprot:XP_009537355.1 hypothetical protein PHYSODRAFT_356062 [Phytophthora sojae]
MAPNTNSSADVCVEDARSSLSLDSYDVGAIMSPRATGKHDPEDVVIFFDWDDTLMASSAIAKLGLCPKYINEEPDIPDEVQAELKELEESVVQLLETALSYGRVVIVTAAETGWVELSASLFMPRLVPFFNTRIKVISARSTYEYLYPDCPRRWKIEAFNNEVFPVWESYGEENSAGIPRHVISLGDGPTEREALINVKMQAMDACHGKSMKFIAYPKISELQLEVELILANMEHLCTHEGDLDLQITWEMLNGGA